jgi:diacylglycerol kinase (ATP)
MARIGLISNPLSRRNSRVLDRLSQTAADYRQVQHRILGEFSELPSIVEDFSTNGAELLIVNGGDGTVQAVLTELQKARDSKQMPLIAVLPGGTTNSIAADVGLRGNLEKSLRRLVSVSALADFEQHVVTRNLVRIETIGDPAVQYGMFFATAGLCPAIRLRRQLYPQTWIPEIVAGAFTMGRVLGSRIVGGQLAERLFDGATVGIALDGNDTLTERYSLVIISTLASSYFNARPFWGRQTGSLKYSQIAAPAPNLLRNLIPYLFGGQDRRLPESYQSGAANQITLRMECEFMLDGEFFQTKPEGRVELSATEPVRFLQC